MIYGGWPHTTTDNKAEQLLALHRIDGRQCSFFQVFDDLVSDVADVWNGLQVMGILQTWDTVGASDRSAGNDTLVVAVTVTSQL